MQECEDMSHQKIRLGLLFGGRSAEHEVSLISVKSILAALDRKKYEITLIGIDKNGGWKLQEELNFLKNEEDPKQIQLLESKNQVVLIPKEKQKQIIHCLDNELKEHLCLDVIFPVLHGTYGEDGTMQGLLKLANIPFVGASVLGSAVAMDKDVAKRLLRDANVPIAKFLTIHDFARQKCSFDFVVEQLGLPFFVKPANTGSSIGVSKVKCEKEFQSAIDEAFLHDRKVLIEECILGREIECGVLGNDHPVASLVGEVIPRHEFYSYEAKYLDQEGAHFQIPVPLASETTAKVQELAILAFRVLCCEGMARVDFFLKENGEVLLNEVNTIPGFTGISMYPKLWEVSGLPYSKLLDCLIELAIERHKKESTLKTSRL